MTKERIHYLSTHLSIQDQSILPFLMGWFRRRPRNEFWRALEAAVALYRPDLQTAEQQEASKNYPYLIGGSDA